MNQETLFTEDDFYGDRPVPGCGTEFFPCPTQEWRNKSRRKKLSVPMCPWYVMCFDQWRLTPEYRFPNGFDAEENGYIDTRRMDDGRYWCLMNLTLGRLRIVIAEDQFTAGEHWCFSDTVAAVRSYMLGPGYPPRGWSRHMTPDGRFEYPDAKHPAS